MHHLETGFPHLKLVPRQYFLRHLKFRADREDKSEFQYFSAV